jgi:tRNA-2-methylthio-N6-dimethylallyladenosine synthase
MAIILKAESVKFTGFLPLAVITLALVRGDQSITIRALECEIHPVYIPAFWISITEHEQVNDKKLHIKTWGCQMNEYDSSKMADLLDATHGYQLTEVAEEADVLLLNTCSIREKAQEKVFHQLGRWKLLKEKNPDLIIGVGVASRKATIFASARTMSILFSGRKPCTACRR